MRDVPTIIWILLVKFNPESNVSFDAHYAVIDNTTLPKHNNDVDTLWTALKKSKSDIIWNGGTYPEKIYKRILVKVLKSGSNAEFNEYVRRKNGTWNETGNIDLYKFFQDWKRQYLNMVNYFFKPDPKDSAIIALTKNSMYLSDKIASMKQNAPRTTVSGSDGGTASC